MSGQTYISNRQRLYGENFRILNADYELWGSKYAHIEIWRAHHGIKLDTGIYIIHHKDHRKKHNTVCQRDDGKCPVWDCGNLGAMTREDHIREHKPGRMGGRKIPGKKGVKQNPLCARCQKVKGSRNGPLCRACRYPGA